MPKRLLKRYLPTTNTIKNIRSLRIFGKRLHDDNLWRLSRYSVARAMAIGLFCCFMPIPFQMVLACVLALMWRANVPLSVALVWITNPLTMTPIFYAAYRVGAYFLPPSYATTFYFDWQTLSHTLNQIWQPLLLGSLICGLTSATLGYLSVHLLWRIAIGRKWRTRRSPTQEN